MTFPDRAFVEAQLSLARPECDLPESPDDDVEIRLGRGLKHPKNKGYAPLLTKLGYDPNIAGMLAARIVEEGRRRAATSRRSVEFAQALRRLANPRVDPESFRATAEVALEIMTETDLMRGLFDDCPSSGDGMLFIGALRLIALGDMSLRTVAMRIAAIVWRRVPTRRGPKVSAASAAHQYFLDVRVPFQSSGYTWSHDADDFVDQLTQATREEFDDPDFNPLPARRRLRATRG